MKYILYLILCIQIVAKAQCSDSLASQQYHDEVGIRNTKMYFKDLGQNITIEAQAPFRLQRTDLKNLAVFTTVTTILLFEDHNFDIFANHLLKKSEFIRKASPRVSDFGSKNAIFTTIGIGVLTTFMNKNRAQQAAILATEAVIASGLFARVGKLVTGRERPSASYDYSHLPAGNWDWMHHIFEFSKRGVSSYDAFPSGHTATAFSIATVFAEMYKEKPWIAFSTYGLATAVGFSRTTEHAHWISDVFVGGTLGYLCGKQIVKHHSKNISLGLNYFQGQPLTSLKIQFF